jgi:recombinational DNA repair protein (RecF pathway)
MYVKYTTEACVVRAQEIGEADRVYTLYTRDFGLLRARASSVRKVTSRMKSALTLGSHITTSLIKGKRGWRLAGALAGTTVPVGSALDAYMRIMRLVERLVQGEEEEVLLYDVLFNAHTALRDQLPPEGVELLTVARVLYRLGYLSPEALGQVLISGAHYRYEEVVGVLEQRSTVLMSVNTALTATQL